MFLAHYKGAEGWRTEQIHQVFRFPGYGGGEAFGGLVTLPTGIRRVLFWDSEGRLTYPCNDLVFDLREDDTFERVEDDTEVLAPRIQPIALTEVFG